MKKIQLTLLVFTLVISSLHAAPVDLETACKAADRFATTSLALHAKAGNSQLVLSNEAFYVFNVGAEGFVILSADDRFRPLVAYSYEGAFDTENPSPEMMYYLNTMAEGRQALLQHGVAPDAVIAQEWSMLLNEGKLPSRNGNKGSFFLVSTKWNQGSPYNKFCPSGCPAGCVATAMSQVMNYWKYPTHGQGSHTYTHFTYGEMSADFGSATYDFDNMPVSIDNMSPSEQIDAVAWFMYHCGIAVDMDYATGGSGAYSQDVPDAVLRFFGYSNRCRHYSRDNYSLKDFQNLLKDQFDMGWPCYYSGSDTEGQGGHAFVCDGYDDRDMFHFNWGWGGSGDGFYAIDELNVSGYAFNSGQAVVANFVPKEVFLSTVKAPEFFTAIPNGDEELSVSLAWTNPSATLAGQDLEAIDQIVVMRDGVVIHTFNNPEPGAPMSYVDVAGLPIMVDYSVHAVSNGYVGRKARVDEVNLGPTCLWQVTMSSPEVAGWNGGTLVIQNSSGLKSAELAPEGNETVQTVEVPQGRLTLLWNAPETETMMGIEILDAEGKTVFAFEGLSTAMPENIFYEMVNTCGGQETHQHPTQLQALVNEADIELSWNGIEDPGYGYIIYRDGFFYTMVTEATSFTDANAAAAGHDYFVTAFCFEGETEPSNTVSAESETPDTAPRNLDFEVLANGKVKLSWEKPINEENHEGYIVYRKAEGENYKRLKPLGASATEFTDPTIVTNGHRYHYRITSMHGQGKAAVESSPAHSLKHPELRYVEVNRTHIPSNLQVEEQDGQVLLQWDPAWHAETYNVYCNGELVASDLAEPTCTDSIRASALVYQVTGVVNGVESSPSNKAYYGNVAVDESQPDAMSVFPNPTQGIVTVHADGLMETEVFNVSGQRLLVRKADGNATSLDLSEYGPGVYYLRMTMAKGHRIQKVVLMN